MLSCIEMKRIRISGSKNQMHGVVNSLYELNLLHLIRFEKKEEKQEFFDLAEPFEEGATYSDYLVKLRAIISQLGLKGKSLNVADFEKACQRFNELRKDFLEKTKKSEELHRQKEKLSEQIANPLLLLELPYNLFEGYRTLHVLKGTISDQKNFFEKELSEKVKQFELFQKPFGKTEKVIALFVMKEESEPALEVLKKFSFKEKELEKDALQLDLKRELEMVSDKLKVAERDTERFKEDNNAFLLGFEKILSTLSEKADAPLSFASSKTAFLINGWVPSKQFKKLQESLEKSTEGKVFVEEIIIEEKEALAHGKEHIHEAGAHAVKEVYGKEAHGKEVHETIHLIEEEPPIALENPKVVKPFEFFLDLYSLPKYYELDPSILMAFTFPLFFGFMLGDIGYGLTTFFLFWLIRKKIKVKEVQALTTVLMIASIASIIFGFVFGEFYGFEIFEKPLIHRVHEINLMILISVIVGLIHLNVGFIIGFFNAMKKHSVFKAFCEKGSWIVVELGAAVIASGMLGINIPFQSIIGGIIVLAGIALLYMGEGVTGLIELPSLLSHTLSYTRLFGIGLASVELALIINKFVGEFMQMGIVGIIAGILILVLGHALNIFLGVLGPFIQSIRLHYVEFFTKFFKGGGVPYAPFGQKNLEVE